MVRNEVTKTSQVRNEVTKTSQVRNEVTKTSQVRNEVTKTSQVRNEVTKTSQVQNQKICGHCLKKQSILSFFTLDLTRCDLTNDICINCQDFYFRYCYFKPLSKLQIHINTLIKW